MFRRSIRRAFAPQNLLVTTLVALSVTGVAVAAATVGSAQLKKNAVTSAKIKKNAVTSSKIKNNSVTSAKVKNRSIGGVDIKNNAIKGRQINEATLAKVPSAAAADTATTAATATKAADADKLGGLAASSFVRSDAVFFTSAKLADGQSKVLASHGPVSLVASCAVNNGGDDILTVHAATTQDGAFLISDQDGFSGGADPTDFLNTTTPLGDREVTITDVSTGTVRMDQEIDAGFVIGPDGSFVGWDGESTALGLNVLGAACVYAGYFSTGTIA